MDKDVDILKSKVTQILKRDISNNMSLIPEEEMMLYDSVCETTNEKDYSIIDYQIGFSPISDSFNSSLPSEIFRIKNIDTGEELDIRDENKETFGRKASSFFLQDEEFVKERRKMNASL